MAAPKKSSTRKRATKSTSTAKKPPAKKSTAKKSPAKKPTAKKSTAKKPTAKKPTRRYGEAASDKVEKAMHERKRGTLRSGSGQKVTSRKQAIAIGLSQARKRGAKVPKKVAA
jgi:Family of unknown function (DUF6496)